MTKAFSGGDFPVGRNAAKRQKICLLQRRRGTALAVDEEKTASEIFALLIRQPTAATFSAGEG